jgi:toxin ParE1/3/4
MKRYKVYWTHEAEIDLGEIVEYIAGDRVPAARSIYQKIKEKCRHLTTNPEIHRRVPELLDLGISQYREVIHPPYRVVYKLSDSESTVYIVAVVDGRRDLETLFLRRLLRK